jgi:DNA-binding Lrp family transcriptional regulator
MFDARDYEILAHVQLGLPLCPRPYEAVGTALDMSEQEVLERLKRLKQQGLIKRLGVIVKHHRLGYRANAMIVWNVPEVLIKALGQRISQFSFVTLCYQRPKQPEWPYNLYCMIHGKDRQTVLAQLEQLNADCGIKHLESTVLFSLRCFKQRGALYQPIDKPILAHGCY